jgi:hydrogenase-4 component B
MNPLVAILVGTGIVTASAVVAPAFARAPRLATSITTWGAVLGAGLGLWGSGATLGSGFAGELSAPWRVPGGALVLGIDALSAFFLAPLFGLGALCAVYGRGYLGARVFPAALFNLLLGAMSVVLLARHALLLLVAWEVMTLLAYLLVTLNDSEAEVRRAGWVYLIASHVAMIALLALFVGLGSHAQGLLDFAALSDAWRAPREGAAGLLALALLGFGVKSGVVGLHVWLPEAHAAAPSHVSALMSGVLVKLGLYGLLRVTLLVPPDARFGIALMTLGVAGAFIGIALALQQRDLKRVLAYSSVENVGIILVGLGLGFWARAHGDTRLGALAFGAGLLHVWNHAAMKGLMFLAAGNVVHGTGSRDIERLGGLLRRMPWTGRTMILGAVAIAGLPPLNGFAGEWLLYRALAQVGLREPAPAGLLAIGGAAALALVGGLAALCFVRLLGVVLLGAPRSDAAQHAHEAHLTMTAPLAALASVCCAFALATPFLTSAQAGVLEQLHAAGRPELAAAASIASPLVTVNAVLIAAIGALTALLVSRSGKARRAETWGCGYADPSPRMQYTGRAFSELVTTRVLPRWARLPLRVLLPRGPLPGSAGLASDPTDPLTRALYEPFLERWGDRLARLGFLQQGKLHIYLVYILTTAIGALAWVAVRDWTAP